MGGGARAAQAPVAPGAIPAPQAGSQPGALAFGREAADACAGLSEGAACSFRSADRTVAGTCVRAPGVVGMGAAWLLERTRKRLWAGVLMLVVAAGTLGYQAFAFRQYGESLGVLAIAALLLLIGGLLLIPARTRPLAVALTLVAMLIAPAYWTGMTVAADADQNLPSAYPGARQFRPGPGARVAAAGPREAGGVRTDLVAYLQANTRDVEYLVAVPSSQTGAPLVLATGRPVLYMGGFSGQDRVVTAEDLQEMVASGRLRYVLYGGMGGRQDIAAWLQSSCTVVPEFSASGGEGQRGPADRGIVLYRCGE
jgi:hypothetical protein